MILHLVADVAWLGVEVFVLALVFAVRRLGKRTGCREPRALDLMLGAAVTYWASMLVWTLVPDGGTTRAVLEIVAAVAVTVALAVAFAVVARR